MSKEYDPRAIEGKWQKEWEASHLYEAKEGEDKHYTLVEFPYPSGAGLHVGHARSWSAMDAYSRRPGSLRRQQGARCGVPGHIALDHLAQAAGRCIGAPLNPDALISRPVFVADCNGKNVFVFKR